MDIKKIIAKLPAGFAEEAAGLSATQLRAEIIKSETAIRWTEQESAADEELSGARALVKDLSAPYREAKGAQTAKIKYVLHVLEERGELGTGKYAPDEKEED